MMVMNQQCVICVEWSFTQVKENYWECVYVIHVFMLHPLRIFTMPVVVPFIKSDMILLAWREWTLTLDILYP